MDDFRSRKRNSIWLPRDLLESRLFWSMSNAAVRVYVIFRTRVIYRREKDPKNSIRWVMGNNGELVFTYHEAEKMGISQRNFTRAIDQLVEKGFIDISKQGGKIRGDFSLYAISDRWKDWGTEMYRNGKRRKRSRWIP